MANKTITFGADLLPNSTSSSYSLGNSTKKWQINGVADPKLTDTIYSTGTATVAGITKLYTSTGTATDGTMTQNAIKSALDGKANSSHGNHVPAKETADHARYLRNDNTWQTVTPEKIGAAVSDHIHFFAGSDSVGGSAKSAVKLNTARTIGIGTGAVGTATSFDGSANITIPITEVKESYLSWGGKNFSGSYGPIDAAMVPDLGANRLAFMPAAGIEVQYSTNGGSTWSTYSTTDVDKINLFNGNGCSYHIGASSATGIDKSNYQLRVIITTNIARVYTVLNKFVIYCSTEGSTGSWCTIDAKTKANVDSGTDTWVTYANKVHIAGWSGYNIINTTGIVTYGNWSDQYQKLRFTFGVTSHASTVSNAGLNIIKIMGFGGVGWTIPSNMARYGHMYTYDAAQNVTFPAGVTAKTFNGNLNGNANTATKLTTSAGSGTQPIYFSDGKPVAATYSLNKTVPSDAKFTDTTYSAGTGISLSGTTFNNSGVRSITTGGTNGTISVNTNGTTANVAVKGLGSAAYTDSSAYATSGHTHNYAGSSSEGGSATSALNSNKINGYGLVVSSSAPPANGTYTNTIYIQYE